MRARVNHSAAFALISLLLAAAMMLWLLGPVDDAPDSVAFAAALVAIVALPVSLAISLAGLFVRVPGAMKLTLVGAVAAACVAGTGPLASILLADDPTDPAWIHAFAWGAPFALAASSVLAGVALFRALNGMAVIARVALTVPLAVVSAILTAFVALQTMPALVAAVALPIAMFLTRWYRMRRAATSTA
jgi:hypothetical protein